jgi:hypothetical protein
MRILIAIGALAAGVAACSDDGAGAAPGPGQPAGEVVVFEAGPTVAQCAAPATTVGQSAAKLASIGIAARHSGCGLRTGVAYPAVCGGDTAQIIVHNIPEHSLPAARAAGFAPAESLVNELYGTSWRRMSCQGSNPFFEFARQQAGCAQTTNRLFFISNPARFDVEMVLLDQAGTCADADFRQILFGETVDDVLCTHAQSIAGPMKRCPAAEYAAVFDTMIAHLDKPDLGLGPGYDVQQFSAMR